MMNRYLLTSAFLFTISLAIAQKTGYQIKVKIEGYQGKEAYLGYYFGDKQYLKDTSYLESDGYFYFENPEQLAGGIYLIVMPPDNQFFQILVDKDNQWFTVETEAPDFVTPMKFKGSSDNQHFNDYIKFLNDKRPEAEALRKQLDESGNENNTKQKLETKINTIDQDVKKYQLDLISKFSNTLTAAIIRANMPFDMPEFTGEQKEKEMNQFYWLRQHWFDNIDLTDPRMIRTPFLFQKIDHYVQKMTVQHPDSIVIAVDYILEKTRPAEETFRYFLIHFLNFYAKSNLVGMDAVYVHVAEKYYATGLAAWTDAEQIEKIVDNATRLKPLLIGKTAPDIEMETQTGSRISLHQFKSPFTVLFFWDPDCGHCKSSMPDMVKFAKEYKSKGIAVFAVCTKLVTRDDNGNLSLKEVNSCWDLIKEKEMDVFFNTVDPYHRSRYKTIYDLRSTPQIYVLDENKVILSKRIGEKQLPELMDHFIKMRQNGTLNK
jgi:thiol-disulfide isomerase/thioredoxin